MTNEPNTSLLTRYLFENPWPVGLVLLLIGAVIIVRQLQGGTLNRLVPGVVAVVLGVMVLVVGAFVVTAGEQATRLAKALAAAAEEGDVDGALALFAPNASIALERLDAPGMDRSFIDAAVSTLDGVNRVQDNTVTGLKGWTIDGRTGVAEISCITTTSASYGPVPHRWLVRARESADGTWQIDRLVLVRMAGRAPDWGWLR